jgi:signal-transduction protein with cAMP-binding, CBS, and nucleotidyltransferase domain
LLNNTEFLANVPIFSDLDAETLDKIAKSGVLQSYKKNSVILSEEDTGSALFVIAEGKVKISRSSNFIKPLIVSSFIHS